MKEEYKKFINENYNASKILHANGRYHLATYLAGYVLEGYLKIILLLSGAKYESLITHDYKYFERFISASKKSLSQIDIVKVKNLYLFCGDKPIPAWHPNHRYNTDAWNNEKFSNKIQKDIEFIKNELIQLKMKGLL